MLSQTFPEPPFSIKSSNSVNNLRLVKGRGATAELECYDARVTVDSKFALADVATELRRRELEDAFWNEHFPSFLKQYPGMLVAMKDGRLIAVAECREALDAAVTAAGHDPLGVASRYIGRPGEAFIL